MMSIIERQPLEKGEEKLDIMVGFLKFTFDYF